MLSHRRKHFTFNIPIRAEVTSECSQNTSKLQLKTEGLNQNWYFETQKSYITLGKAQQLHTQGIKTGLVHYGPQVNY